MKNYFRNLGPGVLLAATGVGAGDMLTAAVAGAVFGTTLIWAPIVGAIIKGFLSEGIARWQAVTGQTFLRALVTDAPKPVAYIFVSYLVIWGFMAAAAMMAACGLAAHSLIPAIGVKTWAIIHSMAALALVWLGNYRFIESVMKVFIGLLVVTITLSVMRVDVNWSDVLTHLLNPRLSVESVLPLMALIGGVGGSVTLLSYSYWMREKGWESPKMLSTVRLDLFAAYTFVGLFGAAMIIMSANLEPDVLEGAGIILALADEIGKATNVYGRSIFLIGFWGAVFSSIVGVWDGIPYLFDDFVRSMKSISHPEAASDPQQTSGPYRGFLLYLAIPPMVLLFVDKPVAIVIAYTIAGSLFMPLVAFSLLYFNNRKIARAFKNGLVTNAIIVICVALFSALAVTKISGVF